MVCVSRFGGLCVSPYLAERASLTSSRFTSVRDACSQYTNDSCTQGLALAPHFSAQPEIPVASPFVTETPPNALHKKVLGLSWNVD